MWNEINPGVFSRPMTSRTGHVWRERDVWRWSVFNRPDGAESCFPRCIREGEAATLTEAQMAANDFLEIEFST